MLRQGGQKILGVLSPDGLFFSPSAGVMGLDTGNSVSRECRLEKGTPPFRSFGKAKNPATSRPPRSSASSSDEDDH